MGTWVCMISLSSRSVQVCPWDRVQQGHTTLGTYHSLGPPAHNFTQLSAQLSIRPAVDLSLGSEPGKGLLAHRVMHFTNGETCFNGIVRYAYADR